MADNESMDDFPMKSLGSSPQTTKSKKHNLQLNELTKIPPKISKIGFVSQNEIKKISEDKTVHQSLLKLKKDIQGLINFQSPRIGLIEIATTDFSKHRQISQNFQLITLDGEPIHELMLCKKCKQVRAQARMTATPILRHLKLHAQEEKARKIRQKKKEDKNNNGALYASSLKHAMKNSIPIPNDAQECGDNLPRYLRIGIELTIMRQGDPEDQQRLYKILKRNLWKKIDMEKSKIKKKQFNEDLTSLENIYTQAKGCPKAKIPEVENGKAPKISFVEPENIQCPQSKESVGPSPIPEVSNNCASINLPAQEIIDVDGSENLSSASVGNENSINISSPAVENEIKLEAYDA